MARRLTPEQEDLENESRLLRLLDRPSPITPEDRVAFANEVCPVLCGIRNRESREAFANQIAEKLKLDRRTWLAELAKAKALHTWL